MFKNIVLGFFFILFVTKGISQSQVNNYKYILVPEKYGFLNEADAYQLNSLTKFLFSKYGFTAFIEGEELPVDLQDNGCLALRADLMRSSGLFLTKIKVELRDCRGIVIYTSNEGTSKEKDYKRSYQEALRGAFNSIERLNYTYQPKDQVRPVDKGIDLTSENNNQKKEVVIKPVPEIQDNMVEKLYSLNNSNFFIKPETSGNYILLKKEDDKELEMARLYKTTRDNDFIVYGKGYDGNGYFDNYGNFILHRLNPVTGKVIKDTFGRQ